MEFWVNHGWWFLLGCVVWPRLIIAIVGMHYWDTNPTLCVCAWLCAVPSDLCIAYRSKE